MYINREITLLYVRVFQAGNIRIDFEHSIVREARFVFHDLCTHANFYFQDDKYVLEIYLFHNSQIWNEEE